MAFDEGLMQRSCKHTWQLQRARFRPDTVTSPQTGAGQGQIWLGRSRETTCVESEQSGPLTSPQHQLGRDQSRNQSVVIVLVNTVTGNETPRRARDPEVCGEPQRRRAFVGTARGPRGPVKRLPVSVLSQVEGGGGLEATKSEFLQSLGAVGALTRSTVGTCQVIGPYGFIFL